MPFCGVTLRGQKPLPAPYPRKLKALGDQLRKRRLELGLLQKEVASHLGVNKTTVYNCERHRTHPRAQVLPSLKEFLGYARSAHGGRLHDLGEPCAADDS